MSGVDESLRRIAVELERQLDGLVETMLKRMRDEVLDFPVEQRPELAEALRDSCYGNLRVLLQRLAGDRQPPTTTPGEAFQEAVVTARAGISLAPLLQTYRIGQAVVWERFLDLAEQAELPPRESSAVLRIGSRFFFAYIDAVVPMVTHEYQRERERLVRTSTQRRVQLVRDVLDGGWADAGELGYDLDAEHVGVVVVGDHAERALQQLAASCGRSLVTVAVADRKLWAWLGSSARDARTLWPALVRAFPPDAYELAVGEPAPGADGFRETHVQAMAARGVGARLDGRIVRDDYVALEALALADAGAAQRFAARELGSLSADDDRAARLRETLATYLAASMNASATAATLGITDRAVGYRLRSVEEALGRGVAGRSAELAVALRVHRLAAPLPTARSEDREDEGFGSR